MRHAGLILTNIWMYGILSVATLAILLLFAPWVAAAAIAGRPVEPAARKCIWVYGRVCAIAARPAVRIEMDGASALAGAPASVVVANHQSFFDTYLFGAQRAANLGFMIKGWPFEKLFFFSPLMRLAGYIETGAGSPEETLALCRKELAEGNHLVGFPEGTRSPDGKLGRFHSGAFMLAMETGVRVVPMVIHDSHKVLPKGGRLFRPGTIHVEFLPPVDTAAFAGELVPHGALRRHVRALMAERLEKRKSAGGEIPV